jgi:dipeptidyl aminopeptidase/acylaminoacyl peptidase
VAATRSFPRSFETAWSWWRQAFAPGFGQTSGGFNLACSPDGTQAAFTGISQSRLHGVPSKSICLLDLDTRCVRRLSDGDSNSFEPKWSPSGERLAFITDQHRSGRFRPSVVDVLKPDRRISISMSGLTTEHVEWSPDGRFLVVFAAEEGAAHPALSSSGRASAADQSDGVPAWLPHVQRSGAEIGGWRRAFVVGLQDQNISMVSGPGLNIWEGCVAGDAVLAVASDRPTEGDWFNTRLILLSLDGTTTQTVYEPRWQLGWPAATRDGARLAIVEGIASDRGVVAGEILLFERDATGARKLDTGGVDTTWLQFRDEGHLCFGGLRDTDTVFGEINLSTGSITPHLEGGFTTSGTYPSASVCSRGGLLMLGEEWQRPPFVAHVDGGKVEEIASLSHPGFDWLRSQLTPMHRLSWLSGDGLPVSGLLTTPREGSGPFPTVLLIHGGPSNLWTPGWPGRIGMLMVASYLESKGYCLLLPNPRGSSGRGQEFLRLELGDYGGMEVEDHLAGIDMLVAQGIADVERLAVMGASHGGYMTCRIATRTNRFKAGVAISPYVDFYSQHFGGNIPEFDMQYLESDPYHPGGPYVERSPIFAAKSCSTPVLLTAGGRDDNTPPGQAVEFHHALLAEGVDSELVIYPQEAHGVTSLPAEIDLAARVAEFLERYLGADPTERP